MRKVFNSDAFEAVKNGPGPEGGSPAEYRDGKNMELAGGSRYEPGWKGGEPLPKNPANTAYFRTDQGSAEEGGEYCRQLMERARAAQSALMAENHAKSPQLKDAEVQKSYPQDLNR